MLAMAPVLLSALLTGFIVRAVSCACDGATFLRNEGRYLPGHVINSRETTSEAECTILCSSVGDCSSVNYKTTGEAKGLCELNNGILSEENGSTRPEFVHIAIVARTCRNNYILVPETKQCVLPLSCKDVWDRNKDLGNGVYSMKEAGGSSDYPVYCHMEEIPGCGEGGWTLAMKLNGTKDTFKNSSSYWSDKNTYQVKEGLEGLTEKETKLQSYWNTPFTNLCVGMRFNGSTNWIKINFTANSLHSVIADGVYRPTNAGRAAWKSLVTNSSLQFHCNKEGFNIRNVERPGIYAFDLRFGFVTNNEPECLSCDSFIGFGAHFQGCLQPLRSTTTGNLAPCFPVDNGWKEIATFGYIFVQ